MKKTNYYKILQVASDASPEVITSAWRTIMSKLKKHPDLGGNQEEAVLINEAYETLSNPVRRAKYNVELVTKETDETTASETVLERRRVPRHDVDTTVSYCISHDQNWYSARVKDISILGIRLQSHEPFKEGQKLVIAPTNLASPAIHGMVRWKRMFHPSTFERVYEAGIEFFDQITDIEDRIS